MDATPEASPGIAQSAASSLLSQSFFRQKMQDATSEIIERMMKKRDEEGSSSTDSAASASDTIMADVALATSSLSISVSGGEISGTHSNTIATESLFSYSQLDHGRNGVEEDRVAAPSAQSDHGVR